METILKPTYKCDHCSKLYQRINAAVEHEKRCPKNPDNFRICHRCSNLVKQTKERFYDSYFGEQSEDVEALYCNKLECFVYPAVIEHKKSWYEFGDIDNIPMKKECEFIEYDF